MQPPFSQRVSNWTFILQDIRSVECTYKKPRNSNELRGFLTTGGRGGIRTLDRARPYAAFPGRYIQPLCHPSRMGSTKAFKPVPNKGLRLQDNQRYRLARLEIIRMHITLSRHSHNIFLIADIGTSVTVPKSSLFILSFVLLFF